MYYWWLSCLVVYNSLAPSKRQDHFTLQLPKMCLVCKFPLINSTIYQTGVASLFPASVSFAYRDEFSVPGPFPESACTKPPNSTAIFILYRQLFSGEKRSQQNRNGAHIDTYQWKMHCLNHGPNKWKGNFITVPLPPPAPHLLPSLMIMIAFVFIIQALN